LQRTAAGGSVLICLLACIVILGQEAKASRNNDVSKVCIPFIRLVKSIPVMHTNSKANRNVPLLQASELLICEATPNRNINHKGIARVKHFGFWRLVIVGQFREINKRHFMDFYPTFMNKIIGWGWPTVGQRKFDSGGLAISQGFSRISIGCCGDLGPLACNEGLGVKQSGLSRFFGGNHAGLHRFQLIVINNQNPETNKDAYPGYKKAQIARSWTLVFPWLSMRFCSRTFAGLT